VISKIWRNFPKKKSSKIYQFTQEFFNKKFPIFFLKKKNNCEEFFLKKEKKKE
jgi:hypothetical protein